MHDEPYWEVHPGDGPYLLLVHGFLSSRAQWGANIAALGNVCRPVVMELFGHGRSPSPKNSGSYRVEHYVAAMEGIRERLGADTWFVCGYSLGAAISIRYALTHPARLRGHIFTNSASAFADAGLADAWRANARESAQRIRDGGMDAVNRMAVHPRRAKRLPKALHEALVKDAERIDPAGIAGAIEGTMPTASVREAIRGNRVPALLVCGRFEKRFAPHRDHAAAEMPQLAIVDVDSGHAVNMATAAAFNAAVSAFVAKHR